LQSTIDAKRGSKKKKAKKSKKLKKTKQKGAALTREALSDTVSEMSRMNTAQLLGLPGMESKRVDMILAGAILFEECLRALGAKKFEFTPFALRDGVLEEEMRLYLSKKSSHISLHLGELEERALRLGCLESHFKKVAHSAGILFDRLKPIHRLGQQWKVYLTAAAILHDCGEPINPSRHGEHAYYVIKNADFPALEKWEVEFLALLARWHGGGKVDPKEIRSLKDHVEPKQFLVILALLRVADALDRGHRGQATLRDIKIGRKEITLILDSKGAVDLEILRVEQKKGLFEEVFARGLLAVQKKGR
jgi:exopolyphosphatase/guanosine-5'-triphosphate,3'-diphosphate pyrophosphatase